jgi:hypothetical protein
MHSVTVNDTMVQGFQNRNHSGSQAIVEKNIQSPLRMQLCNIKQS